MYTQNTIFGFDKFDFERNKRIKLHRNNKLRSDVLGLPNCRSGCE